MTTSTAEPTARRRVAVTIGPLVVLVIATTAAALLWHASTIEVDEGAPIDVDVFPVKAWPAPFGYVLHESISESGHIELVAIGDAGAVLGRSPGTSGRLARVSAAGDLLVFDDVDDSSRWFSATELTVTRFEGSVLQEQWSRGFTVEGSDEVVEELDMVAHDPQGRSVVFGCATTAGCVLIGVDARGEEMWRRAADGGRPATPTETAHAGRPWPVPEELVVIQDPLSGSPEENHPIRGVDVATGTVTELTHGAHLVAGTGFQVASRVEGDGCEIEVLRDQQTTWLSDVPCSHDGGPPHLELFGETVTYVGDDEELVVIDVLREEVGSLPVRAAARGASGSGTTAERAADGTVLLRRIADDELLFEAGEDWRIGAIGVDAVVLHRERTSRNPFAPDRWTDVLVIDSRTGDTCADSTLAGAYGSNRALAGCRALVDVDGQTHLIGP